MKCSSSSLCLCGAFSGSAAMPSLASLFLLLLSFLSLPFVSAATSFEACQSQTRCGNINISYPFGSDDQGCGDPDFQIHGCDLDDPYITMNETKLHVLHIESNWSSAEIEIKISVESDCFDFSKLQSGALKYGSEFNFTYTDAAASLVEVINCSTNLSDKSPGWWPLCSSWYIFFGLNTLPYEEYCYEQSLVNMTIKWTESDFKTNGKKILEDKGIRVLGKVLNERQSYCSKCEETGGICGYYTSNHSFACWGPPGPSPSKNSNMPKIIGIAAGTAGLLVFLLILATVLWKFISCSHPADLSIEPFLTDEKSLGHLQIFSYEELKDATSSFAEENIVGRGGFGAVYKGKLRDGRIVAVKRLHRQHSAIVSEFLNEAQAYSNLQHPNIVALYGCSIPQNKNSHDYFLLVFEFVCNGTLADHLHGKRRTLEGLSWNMRLKIAVQTGEALAFLHKKEQPVLHRDVKSSNILIDKHLDAKVADLGICKAVPLETSHVTTAPVGTPGYMDPQYYESFYLTDKSDVYSFGVVLLEIVSGLKAVDLSRISEEMNLANMMKARIHDFSSLKEVVDAEIATLMETDESIGKTVMEVTRLACSCVETDRNKRPCMQVVADCLKTMALNVDCGRQLEGVTPPVTN